MTVFPSFSGSLCFEKPFFNGDKDIYTNIALFFRRFWMTLLTDALPLIEDDKVCELISCFPATAGLFRKLRDLLRIQFDRITKVN